MTSRAFAALLAIWVSCLPVLAADISVNKLDEGKTAVVTLYGVLKKGDASRFVSTFEQANKDGLVVTAVLGFSPGGDVDEALEIGRFVRKALVSFLGPQVDFDNEFWAELGIPDGERKLGSGPIDFRLVA